MHIQRLLDLLYSHSVQLGMDIDCVCFKEQQVWRTKSVKNNKCEEQKSYIHEKSYKVIYICQLYDQSIFSWWYNSQKEKRGSFGNSENTHREFVELFGHQCPLAHGPSHWLEYMYINVSTKRQVYMYHIYTKKKKNNILTSKIKLIVKKENKNIRRSFYLFFKP